MIEAVHVEKSFGDIKAVDDITLTIQEGRVFGLIGTNGAGKSTMLRIMSGIYKPEAGSVSVDGEQVFENPAAKASMRIPSRISRSMALTHWRFLIRKM